MKVQLNRGEVKGVNRLTITTDLGVNYRISVCEVTGGLVISKYSENTSMIITPRLSNEIVLK